MNDTEQTCDRCGEPDAKFIIEHAMYAEAVCRECRESEALMEARKSVTPWPKWIYDNMREEKD